MQDLNRKDGAELRDFILQELEKQLGKEAVASEINKIRQQGTANGLDISWEAAKDELCARMMPEILLRGRIIEEMAKLNPQMADWLRKSIS
ncbi:MAG: hypothetical protein IJN34_03980 [Clostridia bacterium]|nr:hypothetical protein [Clostridia bacterium]